MPSSTRKDPISNCRYQVEIDGIIQAGFSEVIMPESMSNVIEYREGTDPLRIRKLPGLTLYSNLILKYGVTDAMALYNWRKSVEQGKMSDARRNLAVILLDEEGNAAARWEFGAAWPCAYAAPDLDAEGNDEASETLEITFETMRRVQ